MYRHSTLLPLIDYCSGKKLFRDVEGKGSIDEIYGRNKGALSTSA